MDFKSRINHVFNKLNFKNASVARHSGLDASLISRFRTGMRIPSRGSRQIGNLCKGLVLLALEQGKLVNLCSSCSIDFTDNTELLSSRLEEWLDAADLKEPRHSRSSSEPMQIPQKKLRAFSEKLDALMQAFDISNVRLARLIHTDASLVSRFRTGMRVPTVDSWFPDQFCQLLAERSALISSEDRHRLLHPLLGESIPKSKNTLKAMLLRWMQSEPETKENILMSGFLDKLNAYQPYFDMPQQLVDSLLSSPIPRKATESFYGIEGLREAVKRFLILTATQSEPHTLYLYSDQPMDWMSGDPEYAKIWAALMGIVLHQKNRICIIHTIDRSYEEMFDAIQKWIPLYMTGLIQSYYKVKNHNSCFYQTKFILPDLYCVDASFVTGTEDFAEYILCSDKSKVQYHFRQFQELQNNSSPLLNIFSLRTSDDFYQCAKSLTPIITSEKHLRSTLSISTMPDEIFERILSRSHLTQKGKSLAIEYRQACIAKYQLALKKSSITELIMLPDEKQVLSHEVRIDLPHAIVGQTLYYEETEFYGHIRAIQKLLAENPNYRFYILPETPFENIIISVAGDTQCLVVKIDEPSTAFLFEHTLMNHAFSKYLDSLAQKVLPGEYNRNLVINQLKELAGQ